MSNKLLLRPLNLFTQLNKFSASAEKKKNYSKVSRLKPELEEGFNNQINTEFFASFTYLAMASYFGRQNVMLPGCSKFFMNQALEEREHAQKLIDYLNQRGSTVFHQSISAPQNQCWESPLNAFKEALELEKFVTQKLFELHKMSEECGDLCACNLLENDYLDNQVEEFDTLSRYIAQLEQIGPNGLGIYIFDRHLLKDVKKQT